MHAQNMSLVKMTVQQSTVSISTSLSKKSDEAPSELFIWPSISTATNMQVAMSCNA
jgi:hypothetical protein